MIRQCAWCCRVLGQIAPLEDRAVTHGLCPECHAKLQGTPIQAPAAAAPDSAPGAILSAAASE